MTDQVAMKPATILVINAGSSSIKYGLYNAVDLSRIKREKVSIKQTADYDRAFKDILGLIDTHNIVGIGHRAVHGGKDFSAPKRINVKTLRALKKLTPLAPLHQPHNLKPMELILQKHPKIPQIACFDTAFHRTQPRLNQIYALPREMTDEGILRYGFHGSSYEYIASVLEEHVGKIKSKSRVIVAHLGNGASMCAIKDGKSVATTMGFTPLDGLMMGTRVGEIDPGVSLYLAEQKGMSIAEISQIFGKASGLKGVSGISSDMRELLSSNKPEAKEAIELFCLYAARQAGSLSVDIGGLDVLVFTGGIGENAPVIRQKICGLLKHLGSFDTKVIPTNEELMIAKHVKSALDNPGPQAAPTLEP